MAKCYICNITLCDAATRALRKSDNKYLESFEMWCWRRMEKINWTDRVRNVEVSHTVTEGKKKVVQTIKKEDA
jgi:hypothetical protein